MAMKHSTVIILAVVLGGLIIVFALSRSTALPASSTSAPTSTVASIFNFATTAIGATEKALPKFFDSTPDVTDASLGSYASSSGFADHTN